MYERSESPGYENRVRTKYSGFTVLLLYISPGQKKLRQTRARGTGTLICRACTRLCLACVPQFFLARVVVLLMHPVMMTENQFHCTRLYMYTCCPCVQSEDHMKFVSTGTFFSKTHWETSHQRPQTQQQHKTQHSLTFSKSFNMSRSHCSNSPIRLGDCTRRSTGRGGGPLSDKEKGSLKETK